MCGRYTLAVPLDEIEEALGYPAVAYLEHHPRYNVAPTQAAPVVAVGREGEPRLVPMTWGLVPWWADDPGVGRRMVNARAESAALRPAFRDAFRSRRCLVPADGFYEWVSAGRGRPKRPFLLRRPDGGLLTLGGLWEAWRPAPGEPPLLTFTVLTTEPNGVVGPLHDRMPVVLPPEGRARWLDPDAAPEGLGDLLAPAPDDLLEAVEVSTRVSDPANDDPGCVEPLADAGSSGVAGG